MDIFQRILGAALAVTTVDCHRNNRRIPGHCIEEAERRKIDRSICSKAADPADGTRSNYCLEGAMLKAMGFGRFIKHSGILQLNGRVARPVHFRCIET